MRERQHLDDAIAAVRRSERELEDNIALIEMGEAEGDASIVADAEDLAQPVAGADRDHRRLVDDDAAAEHVDQRVGRAEVDGDVVGEGM